MSHTRILLTVMSMIIIFGVFSYLVTNVFNPPVEDPALSAYDLSRPRAPSDAKSIKSPIPVSGEVIANGKAIYRGKGNCHVCHGMEGKGDGEGGVMLSSTPPDFTDPRFQILRKDGELFWSIKHGVPDTGMFAYVPRQVSEEEAWRVIHYIRTLGRESPGS